MAGPGGTINLTNGNDVFPGPGDNNSGDETVNGLLGNDTIDGGSGNDTLNGNGGNDALSDYSGLTTAMDGGDDDDRIFVGSTFTSGVLIGGLGSDILSAAGTDLSKLTISGFETLETNGGGITGTAAQFESFNVIRVDASSPTAGVRLTLATTGAPQILDLASELTSGGGPRGAELFGSFDDDNVTTGDGADSLFGGSGNDQLSSGGGADTIEDSQGSSTAIDAGAGNDVIRIGNFGSGTVNGGADSDTISLSPVFFTSLSGVTITGVEFLDTNGLIANGRAAQLEAFDTIRFNAANPLAEVRINLLSSGGPTALDLSGELNSSGGPRRVNLDGSADDETVTGGNAGDRLKGFYGNDTLNGGFGGDTLWGDHGDDTLNGGDGDDTLDGSYGTDTLNGGDGNDTITDYSGASAAIDGGAGNDHVTIAGDLLGGTLAGGTGSDTLSLFTSTIAALTISGFEFLETRDWSVTATAAQFESFDTILFFQPGYPTTRVFLVLADAGVSQTLDLSGELNSGGGPRSAGLRGSADADTLTLGNAGDEALGLGGSDTIFGRGGNDVISGGALDDWLYGEAGNDTLDGDEGADRLYGGGDGDTLRGGAGGDIIEGGAGNDSLDGGIGNDELRGGANDDIYFVDSSNDTVVELVGEGTDEIRTTAAVTTLSAWVNNLTGLSDGGQTLNGNELSNVIAGRAGNDTLNGEDGDDQLDGGVGDNTMVGGAGNDIYFVDSANDVVVELPGEGFDEVRTPLATIVLPAWVNNLTGLSATGQFLGGNEINNVVNAGAGNDDLRGGDGNDTLNGNAGNDAAYGGNGNDTMNGGANDDSFLGEAGNDTLNGGDGLDRLYGGDNDDLLNGEAGNDIMEGGAGNDFLDGGTGNDNMRGNDGNDIFFLDNADDFAIELAGQGAADQVRSARAVEFLAAEVENLIGLLNSGQTLNGNGLANIILAGGGGDTIFGGGGGDNIRGGAGGDRIDGGLASDVLFGGSSTDPVGSGNDTFVEHGAAGYDGIYDFEGGAGAGDLVELKTIAGGGLYASAAAAFAALQQIGSNVFLQVDADSGVWLVNRTIVQLNADDFTLIP